MQYFLYSPARKKSLMLNICHCYFVVRVNFTLFIAGETFCVADLFGELLRDSEPLFTLCAAAFSELELRPRILFFLFSAATSMGVEFKIVSASEMSLVILLVTFSSSLPCFCKLYYLWVCKRNSYKDLPHQLSQSYPNRTNHFLVLLVSQCDYAAKWQPAYVDKYNHVLMELFLENCLQYYLFI